MKFSSLRRGINIGHLRVEGHIASGEDVVHISSVGRLIVCLKGYGLGSGLRKVQLRVRSHGCGFVSWTQNIRLI